MKLLRGYVTKERLDLLFKLTTRLGEPTKYALEDFLCKGHTESAAASLNGLKQSNFNRSLATLNEVANIVEEYNQLSDNKKESRES